MAIAVKEIELWRIEVQNEPGILAGALAPLAEAGADLHVVMGYRFPGNESKAAIEVYPVKGKKVAAAAEAAGLQPSSIPTLLVEGDNRPGLGHAIAQALADGGINISFLMAQVVKGEYSAVLGFETADAAKKAIPLVKKAAAMRKK
jgi:hypothetical protein